jgi:hypothetical protein
VAAGCRLWPAFHDDDLLVNSGHPGLGVNAIKRQKDWTAMVTPARGAQRRGHYDLIDAAAPAGADVGRCVLDLVQYPFVGRDRPC